MKTLRLPKEFFDDCEIAFLDLVIGCMSDNENDKHQQGDGQRYTAWKIAGDWFSNSVLVIETEQELGLLSDYLDCLVNEECEPGDLPKGATVSRTSHKPGALDPVMYYWSDRATRKAYHLVEVAKGE